MDRDRVKAAYCESVESPDDYPALDEPPHEKMFERCAKLVALAADELIREVEPLGDPASEAEHILYGVAAEILVNAVHLKVETKDFIEHWESEDATPSFSDSKKVLLQDLEPHLSGENRRVLTLALKILREHRNNLVHIGFHRASFLSHRPLFWEIFAECIKHYSDDVPRQVSILVEKIAEERAGPPRYDDVEFSIN